MVKKEIDAGIIRNLRDKKIAFLPYVSREELRDKLRTDLQALQVAEWNESNYHSMLPRIVAEIWHSYMDRATITATSQLELALEKMKKEAKERIFSEGEDLDFKYIQKTMDRWEPVDFSMYRRIEDRKEVIQEGRYTVNLLALLLLFVRDGYIAIADSDVPGKVKDMLLGASPLLKELPEGHQIWASQAPRLQDELLMFGLIQRTQFTHSIPQVTRSGDLQYRQEVTYRLEFTDKLQRFRYFLAVNKLMPKETGLRPEKPFVLPRP
jgi:hypothetical protein